MEIADKKSRSSLHSCSMRKNFTATLIAEKETLFRHFADDVFPECTGSEVLHLHYQNALRSRTFAPAFFEFFEAVNSTAGNTSCVLLSFY